MVKSQQCSKCYGMFASSEGKHESHQEKTNTTPKGTKMNWVCCNCSQDNKN